MKKGLALLCLGAILVCGGCKRETKDEKFMRDCKQFTEKECPKEIISGVRLDSLCYDIESRTRSEYYTIEGNLDEGSVSTLHEIILGELKSSLQLKPYKDEGISFRYEYHSATTGEKLLDLTFTQEDYGN